MQLRIERRAEIALRSLQKKEQKQIERALEKFGTYDQATLRAKVHMIFTRTSGRRLFVYRGGIRLRLVLSFNDDSCVIEDIVDHDRLNRLVSWGERK